MMFLPALALLSSLWPFHHSGQTVTERYLIPAWHVDTVRDRFTHEAICQVYQGKKRRPEVSYVRQTLAFRFSDKINTTAADFQVERGPVRPWTAIYPQLVGLGATLPGKSMRNPTSGLVILPLSVLKGASTVTIRPDQKHPPRTFSVAGFDEALASAERLGCDRRNGFSRAS